MFCPSHICLVSTQGILRHREYDRWTANNGQAGGQAGRQQHRQADRQAGRQTQTDRTRGMPAAHLQPAWWKGPQSHLQHQSPPATCGGSCQPHGCQTPACQSCSCLHLEVAEPACLSLGCHQRHQVSRRGAPPAPLSLHVHPRQWVSLMVKDGIAVTVYTLHGASCTGRPTHLSSLHMQIQSWQTVLLKGCCTTVVCRQVTATACDCNAGCQKAAQACAKCC